MSNSLPLPRAHPPGVLSSDVPHFTIDLSLPPSQRWSEVVRSYSQYWSGMVEQMWKEYDEADEAEARQMEREAAAANKAKRAKHHQAGGSKKQSAAAAAEAAAAARAARHADHVAFANELSSSLLAQFRREGLSEYAEELEAVSAASGVSVSDLVLLNLSYEAHGGCTSVVVPLPNGDLMMGRTLDWQQPLLRHLTVELSFVREGKLLYRATSFAGFLAIFTGHVPNGYAVAVNFRCEEETDDADDDDEEDEEEEEDVAEDGEERDGEEDGTDASHGHKGANKDDAAADDFSFPVGYLVRHTLERCTDYASAVVLLHTAPLMSHTYFTICGTRGDQALLITRDAFSSVRPMQLDTQASGVATQPAGAAAGGKHAKGDTRVSATAALTGRGKIDALRSYLPGSSSSSAAAASGAASSSSASNAAAAVPSATALASLPPAQPSARPWLVQANMDHWLSSRRLDHQASLPRTKLVHQALQHAVAQGVAHSEARMWQLLSTDPIWDEETIYASVSIPATDRFVTLIENPHPVKKQQAPHARGGRGRKKK